MSDCGVDLLVQGAQVFNVYLRRFLPMDVAVRSGRFFYCGSEESARLKPAELLEAHGLFMVPGLVDIHMHIESSMITPSAFSWALARDGVTTVVSEPHEIANVAGLRGIRAMMEHAPPAGPEILFAIPSSVPATAFETTGGKIGEYEVSVLLDDSRIACLGEVMNFAEATADDSTRTKRIIQLVREKHPHMPIEGHCPRFMGLDLARMLFAGVDSDHTEQTPERLLERVKSGMFVELQYKSLTAEVVRQVMQDRLYEHCCLVTDDTMPDQLLYEGQLSRVFRQAVRQGMGVEEALYMSTYTPCRRMQLTDRGSIAPGKLADFVLLSDVADFRVHSVFKKGREIHSVARPALEPEVRPFPEGCYSSIRLPRLEARDFDLKTPLPDGDGLFRLMVRNETLTGVAQGTVSLPVDGGRVAWQGACSLLAVFERYGKTGNRAYGLVGGCGIRRGAVATTLAHDHHNLLMLGTNPEDMALAANRVIVNKGGYAVADNGTILAEAALPIGGILSDQNLTRTAASLAAVREALESMGDTHVNPLMALSTLSLAVSPELKLTDHGLVLVNEGCLVSLEAR